MSNIHDKLTKVYASNITDQNPDNKQETGVTNTGAKVHYTPHTPPTNMGPQIHFGCPNGKTIQSRKPCLLDLTALPDEARK